MSSSFKEQKPKKVEVFFTDADRLAALAQVHQDILDDEPSGALKLVETRDTAHELIGIIEGHSVATDYEHPVPVILELELDEAQVGTLSLARNFARKDPKQPYSPNELLG